MKFAPVYINDDREKMKGCVIAIGTANAMIGAAPSKKTLFLKLLNDLPFQNKDANTLADVPERNIATVR